MYDSSSIGNHITHCCCTEQYVRYFRRAILETLRVLTDSIAGFDHTASTTASISSFNAAHTACEYTRSISDYVRLYCLNSQSSISGLDTAGVLSVLVVIWEDAATILLAPDSS